MLRHAQPLCLDVMGLTVKSLPKFQRDSVLFLKSVWTVTDYLDFEVDLNPFCIMRWL